jgi:hypothetical protein
MKREAFFLRMSNAKATISERNKKDVENTHLRNDFHDNHGVFLGKSLTITRAFEHLRKKKETTPMWTTKPFGYGSFPVISRGEIMSSDSPVWLSALAKIFQFNGLWWSWIARVNICEGFACNQSSNFSILCCQKWRERDWRKYPQEKENHWKPRTVFYLIFFAFLQGWDSWKISGRKKCEKKFCFGALHKRHSSQTIVGFLNWLSNNPRFNEKEFFWEHPFTCSELAWQKLLNLTKNFIQFQSVTP